MSIAQNIFCFWENHLGEEFGRCIWEKYKFVSKANCSILFRATAELEQLEQITIFTEGGKERGILDI